MIRTALVLGCLVLLAGTPSAQACPVEDLFDVCVSLQEGPGLSQSCDATLCREALDAAHRLLADVILV